jgi:hypothetical protein
MKLRLLHLFEVFFSTYTLEGGKRKINKRGVNISIPLKGQPLFKFCSTVGGDKITTYRLSDR